jgi:DNA-binding NtrC family response regulator
MEIRKEVRLLIVDDHEQHQHMFQDAVDSWHPDYRLECTFAKTAAEALEKIAKWAPTIVMVDAYFEDMNCFDLIGKCNPKACPIVVTSDHLVAGIRESAISRGAADYFSLPNDPDEFDMVMESVVSLSNEIVPHQPQ